jgi:diaminohydroxyphosphoribosylaminopyrimidine deaminase/5-amino-6-(5-phosphoribosylamino)uracil reductase
MDLPGVYDENHGLGTGDEDDAGGGGGFTYNDGSSGRLSFDSGFQLSAIQSTGSGDGWGPSAAGAGAWKQEEAEHVYIPPLTHLWDTSVAPTIVMTQTGARPAFQQQLRNLGVEIVEFDELTPAAVAQYCASRGYLQLFWECGGGLAAPALLDGVFHHVMAFVAPKIVGSAGGEAPTPVGEMGFERMTQALQLRGLQTSMHGRDILISGYVPPGSTAGQLAAGAGEDVAPAVVDPWDEDSFGPVEEAAAAAAAAAASTPGSLAPGISSEIRFYKSWDTYGALSNFSPHAIDMPRVWGRLRKDADAVADANANADGGSCSVEHVGAACCDTVEWPTVEHFYQAQKFSGMGPAAEAALERVRLAGRGCHVSRVTHPFDRLVTKLHIDIDIDTHAHSTTLNLS